VLLAQGLSREEAAQSLRVSFHAASRPEEVDACLNALGRCVKRLLA
jgi:cysteine sulfinate desulfinase/cysteine desulfurase-like protein